MLWGFDVSHFQGAFDFGRARSEGFDFAFLKATEGATYQDPQFRTNLANARGAGLLTAAYHYQQQGTAVADRIRNISAIVPRDCPVVIDVEDGGGHTDQTRETIAALQAAGYTCPLLYLPGWYWQQIGSPDLAGLPPLWSSRYPDTQGGAASAIYQRVPASYWNGYGGASVAILQFSSSATVAGATPVDVNAYPGTRDQLAALLTGGEDDMQLSDTWTDAYGNHQDVQTTLDRMNFLWHEFFDPGSEPSRIPGDANTTNLRDAVMDSTAWTNRILGAVLALQAAGTADSNAVAQALKPVVADVVGPIVAQAVTDAVGSGETELANAIVANIAARLAAESSSPQE